MASNAIGLIEFGPASKIGFRRVREWPEIKRIAGNRRWCFDRRSCGLHWRSLTTSYTEKEKGGDERPHDF
jgi:hypothetical protein